MTMSATFTDKYADDTEFSQSAPPDEFHSFLSGIFQHALMTFSCG